MPFALLGILTLGTGLGVGLGLSEGPVTYSASAEVTGTPCSAMPNDAGMTCRLSSGQVMVWFGQYGRTLSKGSINCVVDGVDGAEAAGHTEPTSLAAVEATVNVLLPECEKGALGAARA